MKRKISALIITAAALITSLPLAAPITYGAAETFNQNTIKIADKNMLNNRGLVVMRTEGDDGNYLTWRLQPEEDAVYGTANEGVTFDIYKDGQPIKFNVDTTNYIDAQGTSTSKYQVFRSGGSYDDCPEVTPLSSGGNYFDIPIQKPDSVVLPITATFKNSAGNAYVGFVGSYDSSNNPVESSNGRFNALTDTFSYAVGDASCGDVDGDGEYEIIFKWECCGKDNSQAGKTGNVYLDAYEMDGTKLWRIDLGQNIRAGAHYTQFLVYDFDGDGKAEVTAKTAPGSKDASGAYVSAASHDNAIKSVTDEINTTDYVNSSGYILSGDEYLTIFNGQTGNAIDTIYYPNQRVDVSVWGDTNGNRVDRFTADVAYLDGVKPYAVYMRGYYFGRNNNQRQAACGVSFDGTRLSCKYSFDTYDVDTYGSKSSSASYNSDGSYKGVKGFVSGNEIYVGQGNHNCTVADVDGDGKDEVMTGALCYEINDDDRLGVKWSTFKGHGDALHIGDYDPTHEGYEFFVVHEEGGETETISGRNITLDFGMSVIDPKDGTLMYHESAAKDTGRGIMANVGMGGYYQFWSAYNDVQIANGGANYSTSSNPKGSQNFRIYWNGDLYEDLLDGTTITTWNGSSFQTIFNVSDVCKSLNSTKSNPALSADLFGDWREEVIYPTTDDSKLRVYTTNIYSPYKMKSLMYDGVYRCGVAAEQTAYNQPPHIGYYLSSEDNTPSEIIQTNSTYEKGTSSATAWKESDISQWTKTGSSTNLSYNASGATYGNISISQQNPSSTISASKTFDIKANSAVTYEINWRYGGAFNHAGDVSTKGTSNANYEYLQIGSKIRLAWYGASNNYNLYYSKDGGQTYTDTGLSRSNTTYNSDVRVICNNKGIITSVTVEGKEIVTDFNPGEITKSVSFGVSKGTSRFYNNSTVPVSTINSIKVFTTSYPDNDESVTITYNSNYGTPTTKTQKIKKGEASKLSANTFIRDGAMFKGWSTSPTGSIDYADGASITISENTTLYAIWNKASTPSAPANLVYNGKEQSGFSDTAAYTVGGEYKATDAGTYTATATLKDGYCWQDGSIDSKTNLTWTISPLTAVMNWSNDTEITYDGKEHNFTPSITNILNGDTCNVTAENATGKYAGSYTVNITGLSNKNYALPENKTQTFTINTAGDPAVITKNAAVTAGGKAINLKENIKDNKGVVTFTLKSGNGTLTDGVYTTPDTAETAVITATIADTDEGGDATPEYEGRSEDITVTVSEQSVEVGPLNITYYIDSKKAEFISSINAPKSAVIFASYDANNKLISALYTSKDITPGENSVDAPEGFVPTENIKIFIWNDINAMTPLFPQTALMTVE